MTPALGNGCLITGSSRGSAVRRPQENRAMLLPRL